MRFFFRFMQHDLTYRVHNAEGHHVAICFLRDTAELLTNALNSYRPESWPSSREKVN